MAQGQFGKTARTNNQLHMIDNRLKVEVSGFCYLQ